MNLALRDQTPHPINQPAALGQTSISTNQPGQEADTIGLGLGVIRPRLNHWGGELGAQGHETAATSAPRSHGERGLLRELSG